MTKYTTYSIAVNWFNNDFVLCNNITDIDGESILMNARFDSYDEENESYLDIFQYFLTDCSESDVEFLEKTFDLKFSYSDKLDCFVLCVDHYGTSWDYVSCEIKDESILKYNPEIEYCDSCNPPMQKTIKSYIAGGKK